MEREKQGGDRKLAAIGHMCVWDRERGEGVPTQKWEKT